MIIFRPSVVITDLHFAEQVFLASSDAFGNVTPNMSRLLGSGSVFAHDGAERRQRRVRHTPPFHCEGVTAFKQIIIEETPREPVSWP